MYISVTDIHICNQSHRFKLVEFRWLIAETKIYKKILWVTVDCNLSPQHVALCLSVVNLHLCINLVTVLQLIWLLEETKSLKYYSCNTNIDVNLIVGREVEGWWIKGHSHVSGNFRGDHWWQPCYCIHLCWFRALC